METAARQQIEQEGESAQRRSSRVRSRSIVQGMADVNLNENDDVEDENTFVASEAFLKTLRPGHGAKKRNQGDGTN